jgi:hypothetical protein
MLKTFVVLLNFVSFSFITFILSDEIKVSTNMPAEVIQDSVYTVEVIIDKGDVIGFAKFQQNMPPGFDVQPGEVADASFTFADGKVKFIWMAIPEQEQVKITYTIKATADAPESATVNGKFSYIDDMERKSYDLPNQSIKVLKSEDIPVILPAMADVSRVVTSKGDNQYEIALVIKKQGISGFSKVEEFLPENASAAVGQNELSVFSQVDEKAKFVWMSIPSDELLNVTYLVTLEGDDAQMQLQSMEGSFSYLDENESKTVAIIGEEVTTPIGSENDLAAAEKESINAASPQTELAETTSETEQVEESAKDIAQEEVDENKIIEPVVEPIESVATVNQDVVQAIQVEEPVVANKENTAMANSQVTNTPSAETGINYKVQILAGHKVVTEAFIKKKYQFSEEFILDNHEGWVKYITGTYPEYKQARDKREGLITAQHNFPGPFVTAYNAGERITVQEALMITNQQWIK